MHERQLTASDLSTVPELVAQGHVRQVDTPRGRTYALTAKGHRELRPGKADPGEQPRRRGVRANVGVTPFQVKAGDRPEGFMESEKWVRFQEDMRKAADRYGVTIHQAAPVQGLWEGETEPALAVEVEDGETGVRAWAAKLGRDYEQDGVLLFREDEEGDAAAALFPGVDPEAFVRAMQQVGLPGGRITDDGVEVMGAGEEFADQLERLAEATGSSYSARLGRMDWDLLGGGEAYDAAVEAGEREARQGRAG